MNGGLGFCQVCVTKGEGGLEWVGVGETGVQVISHASDRWERQWATETQEVRRRLSDQEPKSLWLSAR